MKSYSRTRWLDKLRPAGTPHRWMGRGARWHLSWPLADTTSQKKKTTFLDSCMSSLRLSMLFFSVSFKRIMFVILTQGPCSPVLPDTVGDGVKKLTRAQASVPSRFQSRVQHANSIRLSPIPSYTTARQQFPESCNSLLETAHTHKKKVSSQGPCCSKKKTKTICLVHVIACQFAPGPC